MVGEVDNTEYFPYDNMSDAFTYTQIRTEYLKIYALGVMLNCNVNIGRTDRGYQVGGNQVVGTRQAAVSDASDADDAVRAVNELLARVRSHGLISS